MERIIIVFNLSVIDNSKMVLQKYNKDIVARKNIGFDARAFLIIVLADEGKLEVIHEIK